MENFFPPNFTGNPDITAMEARLMDPTDREIDKAYGVFQSAMPDGHPMKPQSHWTFGEMFMERFQAGHAMRDLDMAIIAFTNAANLTPHPHPQHQQHAGSLGRALVLRAQSTGSLDDIATACSQFEAALNLCPPGHPNRSASLNGLSAALRFRFEHQHQLADLERSTELIQEAVDHSPSGHPGRPILLTTLATCLELSFKYRGNILDLDRAVSIMQEAVRTLPPDRYERQGLMYQLASILSDRYDRVGALDDLQAAIVTFREAISSAQDGDPQKAGSCNSLAGAYHKLFMHTKEPHDLAQAIMTAEQAVALSPEGFFDHKAAALGNLAVVLQERFVQDLGDVSDIDRAIEIMQEAINLLPPDHPQRLGQVHNLAIARQCRILFLGHQGDTESNPASMQDALALLPEHHPDRLDHLISVGLAWKMAFALDRDPEAASKAIRFLSNAAQSSFGSSMTKLDAAWTWAELASQLDGPRAALKAYACAVKLIPEVAWPGFGVQSRHKSLVKKVNIGDMIRDAAAVAIACEDANIALEWLEQGRSVVWGQELQLRLPFDDLRDDHPALAQQLVYVSRRLQGELGDVPHEDRGSNNRALALERERLIAEIRTLQGFSDFLGPKRIGQLASAAANGPVVTLSVHKTGCDALVLIPLFDEVLHISLSDFDVKDAERLRFMLEKEKVTPSRPGRGFVFPRNVDDGRVIIHEILADLWNKVVKPVLDALAFTPTTANNPPRIWWCPTGPLAFLPIHAAGLYHTEEHGSKIFDYVTSSYTPTVSALLQAPYRSAETFRILAVAQAEAPGQSMLPNTTREIDILQDRAGELAITRITGTDGSIERVVRDMKECSWVHFACHGTQDLSEPTKSALLLQDGNLELSEIIKLPLPHAEFAFLSACQTATGDENQEGEAVHLAAGMLLAGYRSVIATMWSIMDNDGPTVADAVYAEMLKNGQPDHTRAAHALHRAVQSLRRSGAPFMSWLPFVHFGA